MSLNKIELTEEELTFLRHCFIASLIDERKGLNPKVVVYYQDRNIDLEVERAKEKYTDPGMRRRLDIIDRLLHKLKLQPFM